jgi:hypothetical protein
MKLPNELKGYVIYEPKTGTYSRGGRSGWGKTPKIWTSLRNLKLHLQMFVSEWSYHKKIYLSSRYKDCVVVDITTGEPSNEIDIYTFLHQEADRIMSQNPSYYKDFTVEIIG